MGLNCALGPLGTWQTMLADVTGGARDGFVDWMQIDRADGQDRDVGLARHWLDPTIPLQIACLITRMGLLLPQPHCKTMQPQKRSMKTRDDGDERLPPVSDRMLAKAPHDGWQSALALTGAAHLDHAAMRVSFSSPLLRQSDTHSGCK